MMMMMMMMMMMPIFLIMIDDVLVCYMKYMHVVSCRVFCDGVIHTLTNVSSEVEAADFCPKFGWPWKMDSSVWCYRACNENGGASFSTQINAAYGPRHCFTMRELNYCKIGSCKFSWNFLWSFVFSLGGLYTAVLRELPWKWSIWSQKRSSLPRN